MPHTQPLACSHPAQSGNSKHSYQLTALHLETAFIEISQGLNEWGRNGPSGTDQDLCPAKHRQVVFSTSLIPRPHRRSMWFGYETSSPSPVTPFLVVQNLHYLCSTYLSFLNRVDDHSTYYLWLKTGVIHSHSHTARPYSGQYQVLKWWSNPVRLPCYMTAHTIKMLLGQEAMRIIKAIFPLRDHINPESHLVAVRIHNWGKPERAPH